MGSLRVQEYGQRHLVFWVGASLVLLWLWGMPFYLESTRYALSLGAGVRGSYQLATHANTLLAAATAVYWANIWARCRSVGKWGTALAAGGAIGLLASLLVRRIEAGNDSGGTLPVLYEVVLLATAGAVIVYLLIEGYYRSQAAGGFVMTVVMGAVACEIWLVSQGLSDLPGGTAPYWARAQSFAHVLGYGAFCLATSAGLAMLFWRPTPAAGRRTPGRRTPPSRENLEHFLAVCLVVGFAVFALAVALEAERAHQVWGRYWSGEAFGPWGLSVLLIYAIPLYLRSIKRLSGTRLAWFAISSFALSLLGFVASNLMLLGWEPVRGVLAFLS